MHLHHLSSVENVSFKLRKEINCREETECNVRCILIVKLLNPTLTARTWWKQVSQGLHTTEAECFMMDLPVGGSRLNSPHSFLKILSDFHGILKFFHAVFRGEESHNFKLRSQHSSASVISNKSEPRFVIKRQIKPPSYKSVMRRRKSDLFNSFRKRGPMGFKLNLSQQIVKSNWVVNLQWGGTAGSGGVLIEN